MKKREMKPFKETLLDLRARLRGDVNTLANAALSNPAKTIGSSSSSIPSHIADMGSDTYEQDNTLLLMTSEGEVLTQIEDALERIEDAVYGTCIECEKVIPKMRLNALPFTPHCVKCASELETNG